jgi:hypothetical protein
VLIGAGLLEGVDRERSRTRGVNEPNKYYLKGCMALTEQREAQATDAATVAGGEVAAA